MRDLSEVIGEVKSFLVEINPKFTKTLQYKFDHGHKNLTKVINKLLSRKSKNRSLSKTMMRLSISQNKII